MDNHKPLKKHFLALALALTLVSCDGGPSEPDPEEHVGTYALLTVNGLNLPFFLGSIEGIDITVLAGHLTLNSDMTAADSYLYRFTNGIDTLEETLSDTGTYTRDGTAITIDWDSQETETYTFNGNDQLTLDVDGLLALYQK